MKVQKSQTEQLDSESQTSSSKGIFSKSNGNSKTPMCPKELPIPQVSRALDLKAPAFKGKPCSETKEGVVFLNSSKESKDPSYVLCFSLVEKEESKQDTRLPSTSEKSKETIESPDEKKIESPDEKKIESPDEKKVESSIDTEKTPESFPLTISSESRLNWEEKLTRFMYTPNLFGKPIPESVPRFSFELAHMIHKIAKHFGKNQITVISGLRSPESAANKGNKKSLHVLGRACDFYINGVPTVEVFDYIRSTYKKEEKGKNQTGKEKNQTGIGVIYYPRWSRDFVHLEVRPDSYFYNNIELSSEKEKSNYCIPPSPPLTKSTNENGKDD